MVLREVVSIMLPDSSTLTETGKVGANWVTPSAAKTHPAPALNQADCINFLLWFVESLRCENPLLETQMINNDMANGNIDFFMIYMLMPY